LEAIAFDLDGTLVDSAADIAAALNIALADERLPTRTLPQVRAWIGDGPDVLIERALVSLGVPEEPALRLALRRRFDAATLAHPLGQGTVFPGITALLAQLHMAVPLAVVTNKPTVLARAVLDAAGLLGLLRSVHGADTPALRKPAPGMLLAVAGDLALPPAQLLMVGDSRADLGCARAAGCPAAWVRWGYGGDVADEAADAWVIDTPAQLLQRWTAATR
jgi:phosphoglycolate phosphatase